MSTDDLGILFLPTAIPDLSAIETYWGGDEELVF